MTPQYFTSKVATNDSFCNRMEESATITHSLQKNQHVVVVAPRRYGKTSLVVNTLKRQAVIFARIDLFCVVYEDDICRKVAKGVSRLVRTITPFTTKSLQFISKCFKRASVSIRAGQVDIKVELEKQISDPTQTL